MKKMPRAGLSCPGCGSSNVVDDDLYCQTQLVCADCGTLVSEGVLADDPEQVRGLEISYSRTTASKKPCMNLIKGLERVKALCRILRVKDEIENLSQKYFRQTYEHESFIRVSLLKKEALAGCCLLASCRLHSWPVNMGTIGYLLDTDKTMMKEVYQEMVKILNVQIPLTSIMDVIEAHSQQYKISSSEVPEELAEDSRVLAKRAMAMLELATDTWIVTGRRPLPLMVAVVYLSWQSLKPTKFRLKYSLDKFCLLAKVDKQRPAMKRVAELKEVLCTLGKEIPWVRETVTPANVLQHVEDILQYRHFLLKKALRTHEDALLAERQASCVDSLKEETTPFQISEPNSSSVEQCEVKAEGAQDGDDKTNTASELHSDTQEGRDPEPNWGKRELFAPPCVIHAKRRRVEQPDLKDVTGDEEISDSEIDSYIRTPQEAREFARMKKMLP